MEKTSKFGELTQGVPLPSGHHHRVTVESSAVVQVVHASGAPATDEPVLVRRADGTQFMRRTNRFGRVHLYDIDPSAPFEVRLTRNAKVVEGSNGS